MNIIKNVNSFVHHASLCASIRDFALNIFMFHRWRHSRAFKVKLHSLRTIQVPIAYNEQRWAFASLLLSSAESILCQNTFQVIEMIYVCILIICKIKWTQVCCIRFVWSRKRGKSKQWKGLSKCWKCDSLFNKS